MKKFLVLVLALAALLCTAALADAPAVSDGSWEDGGWGPPYDHSQAQPLYSFELSEDATVTAMVYYAETGEYFATCLVGGSAADGAAVSAGTVVLYWNGVDANGFHEGVDGQKIYVDYELVIEVTNADGTIAVSEPFTFGYVHSIAQHLNYHVWYSDNHVNSFGPKFEDSWMTYSVVDLSVQGTQTYDLVAAGAWKLGTVSVTVNGDEVVVDYLCDEDINTRDVYDDIFVDREWFTFFADLDAVTTLNPDEIETDYDFGTPISIANDLGGDTIVILYVNNIMTYDHANPFVTRFWPNLPANKALVESMVELLASEVVEEVPAEEVPAE